MTGVYAASGGMEGGVRMAGWIQNGRRGLESRGRANDEDCCSQY
jgi:hypothetical protein